MASATEDALRVEPSPPAEAPVAESTIDSAEAEAQAAPRAPRPSPLAEQHYTIRYGDTGYSYEAIMADYLQGAKHGCGRRPYIRDAASGSELCALLRDGGQPLDDPQDSVCVTGYDDTIQRADAEAKLADLAQSLLELDIVLEVAFDGNLHDREFVWTMAG
jgi:ATP-dependent Lon protease